MKKLLIILLTFLMVACTSRVIPTADEIKKLRTSQPIDNNGDFITNKFKDLYQSTEQFGDLFIVDAISGGGYRAANFGLGHLLALDSIRLPGDKKHTLLDEVDFFSTVSGGGLSVALYNSTLLDYYNCYEQNFPNLSFIQILRKFNQDKLTLLRKGWKNYLLKNALDSNILSKNTTRSTKFRETYFKEFLSKKELDNGKCRIAEQQYTFADVYHSKLPRHIPNATVSTSGHIFPFMKSSLETLKHGNGKPNNLSIVKNGKWEQVEGIHDLPYSFGILSSAAFPPILADTRIGITQISNNRDSSVPEKFIHFTDGGQADDNAYYSALGIIDDFLDERSKINQLPTLLFSVDALNQNDLIFVTQDKPEKIDYVLMTRNVDLPRYALKRQFRRELKSNDEALITSIDASANHSTIHASHINLVDEIVSGAGHSTFYTGKGLNKMQQFKTIVEGMLQTYQSIIGKWQSNKQDKNFADISELRKYVDPVVYALLCPKRDSHCKDILDDDDNNINRKLGWINLENYIQSVLNKNNKQYNLSAPQFISFEKNKKEEIWSNAIIDSFNNLDAFNNKISNKIKLLTNDLSSIETKKIQSKISESLKQKEEKNNNFNNLLLKQFSGIAQKEFENMKKLHKLISNKSKFINSSATIIEETLQTISKDKTIKDLGTKIRNFSNSNLDSEGCLVCSKFNESGIFCNMKFDKTDFYIKSDIEPSVNQEENRICVVETDIESSLSQMDHLLDSNFLAEFKESDEENIKNNFTNVLDNLKSNTTEVIKNITDLANNQFIKLENVVDKVFLFFRDRSEINHELTVNLIELNKLCESSMPLITSIKNINYSIIPSSVYVLFQNLKSASENINQHCNSTSEIALNNEISKDNTIQLALGNIQSLTTQLSEDYESIITNLNKKIKEITDSAGKQRTGLLNFSKEAIDFNSNLRQKITNVSERQKGPLETRFLNRKDTSLILCPNSNDSSTATESESCLLSSMPVNKKTECEKLINLGSEFNHSSQFKSYLSCEKSETNNYLFNIITKLADFPLNKRNAISFDNIIEKSYP